MRLLLPPSETKREGGEGEPLDDPALFAAEHLTDARHSVRSALVEVSSDGEAAAKALKLGVKNRHEAERNLVLDSSPTMPAIERYTGVLYDALALDELDEAARSWVSEHVMIQSALFGLLRAEDSIPAYRVSGSSRLPALEAPLKRVWSEAHQAIGFGDEFVLDARSNDYVALAPVADAYFLKVVQRGENGEVKALNHFNKAAKGDLVRRLALSHARVDTVQDLLQWASEHDLEMTCDSDAREITLVTTLGVPKR